MALRLVRSLVLHIITSPSHEMTLPLLRADCSTTVTNVTLLGNGTLRSSCFLSTNQRIGIYAGTTATAILINIARTITFYFLCVNASRVLHNRMFATILRAPVLFFDTNPIGELDCLSVAIIQHHSCLALPSAGRVLNRFAKDVGFLDDLLPLTFCEFLLVNVQPAKKSLLLCTWSNAHTLVCNQFLIGVVLFFSPYLFLHSCSCGSLPSS